MNRIRKVAVVLGITMILAGRSLAGWSEPVPVTELNMSGDEFSPYLSADGNVMIFSAEGTITMSHWQGDHWGRREYLPAPINYVGLQTVGAITPDLQWIYWVSWRDGGMGMWDIWRSHWSDSCQCWGLPECLGENINSPSIEWGLCFTADGQRMYFTTDAYEKNGQFKIGFMDIWYCDWDSTIGDWGLPYHLPVPVNSPSDDVVSYIAADGNSLYFYDPSSHGVPGWQGGYEIFKATWNGISWGNVESLLAPINSPTDDISASVTPDNQKLYFATRRDRLPNGDYELMVSSWDPTGIGEANGDNLPKDNSLAIKLYPNPFNNEIKIDISTGDSGMGKLSIYNLLGQKIRDYQLNITAPGATTIWDGRNYLGKEVASGQYLFIVGTRDQKKISKIATLLK